MSGQLLSTGKHSMMVFYCSCDNDNTFSPGLSPSSATALLRPLPLALGLSHTALLSVPLTHAPSLPGPLPVLLPQPGQLSWSCPSYR